MWHGVWNTLSLIFETVLNMPLRELYRYGPAVIGWEGESLPKICARITFHGDELFWMRNVEECQRIFSLKEDAWLRLTRPIVYLGLLCAVVQIARMLVREHALQQRPQNRDMVETYQAFQILMRQVKRGLNSHRDHKHHD
jgi:nitrate reductase gamma subunit